MTLPECTTQDLTKEKSLWDIYSASRRIHSGKFNKMATSIVFGLLFLQCWISEQSVSSTIDVVRKVADIGLVAALSTLGLLLAGFTIFATISQPSLLLRMSEETHPDSGLSWLKHNFFIFVRVLIYYMFFSVFYLFIIMFGHKDGLIGTLISYSPHPTELKFFIAKSSYVAFFTGFFFLLLQLKSFIFNVYHAVMTALRWKAEGYDNETT